MTEKEKILVWLFDYVLVRLCFYLTIAVIIAAAWQDMNGGTWIGAGIAIALLLRILWWIYH